MHNKLTMNSDFDIELLNEELNDLDIDLDEYGFDNLDFELDNNITDNKEINIGDYNDEEFRHECPKCHFKFN